MLQQLNNSNFYRNILNLLRGSILGQLIPLILSPLLTRFYSVGDFGDYAVYVSLTTIFSTVTTGRYELAILLPINRARGFELTFVAILLCFLGSIFLFIIIINYSFGFPRWTIFLPFTVLFYGINQALIGWFNREKLYKKISNFRIIQSGVIGIFSITFGFFKIIDFGLIVSQLIGIIVSTLYLFLGISKDDSLNITRLKKRNLIALICYFKEYPKLNLGSSLLNTASIQLPTILFSFFFNSTVVGAYSLANRMLNLPMSFIGTSISQVYFQQAVELKCNLIELKILTLKLFKNLMLLGSLPVILVFIFGENLFIFFFGKEWGMAGRFSELMSFWILLVFISSPLSSLLLVFEKHRESLYFNVGLLLSRLIIILLGGIFLFSGELTIFLYSLIGILFWLYFIFFLLKIVDFDSKKVFNLLLVYFFPIAILSVIIKLLVNFI